MTVNKTNRSHRIAFLVVILVVAVALTTALVLASERSSTVSPKSAKSSNPNTVLLHFPSGGWEC